MSPLMGFRVLLLASRNECHCSAPTVMDLYSTERGWSSRGLCVGCSLVRCDAFPGACK